jgi:hypothetical protein
MCLIALKGTTIPPPPPYPRSPRPHHTTTKTNAAGDGTVPERSLWRPIYEWGAQAGPQAGWELTHHTFTGVDHMDTMNYRPFFRALTDILAGAVAHTPPSPEALAAEKPPDWGWVMRKKFEAWDPWEQVFDAAEKALGDGHWPWQ